MREQVKNERDRAAAAAEREKARMGRAAAEAGLEGLREALAEARRPFWRRWALVHGYAGSRAKSKAWGKQRFLKFAVFSRI